MSSRTRKGRGARGHTAAPPNALTSESAPRGANATKSHNTALWIGAALVVLIVLMVLVATWLLLLLGIIGSKVVKPTVYSPDGRISFVRKGEDGKTDLYVINPDGTNQQRVTENLPIEGTNAWSPDGRRLLLQASVGGISTVVRMDIGPDNKSANAVQLTADVKVDSAFPSWSPDGTQVLFQSKRDGGNSQVFVMNTEGNGKRRLSDGKGYAGQPAWSPDGKSVVYVQGDKPDLGTPKELYVAPVAGGAPRKLTSLGRDVSRPQWSPDGKSIVYTESNGDRARSIFKINADGTSPQPEVMVDQGANINPQFSPAGDKIAFYAIVGTTGSDIFIMPTSGGALSNLTHLSSDDYEPVWSPDGQRLAWASKRGTNYKIVVGNADGSNQKVITQGTDADYQPTWGAPVK